jgi:hypothetical protein
MKMRHPGNLTMALFIVSTRFLGHGPKVHDVSRTHMTLTRNGIDHRVSHFQPPNMAEVVPKSAVLQVCSCFYLGYRRSG